MFTMPMIPAAVRSRMERAEARRGFAELIDALNDTFDDLDATSDHDVRAALLDFAGRLTGRLAQLYTAAWGDVRDADGRPMPEVLTSGAALLHRIAVTERAVIGAVSWSDADPMPSGESPAERRVWTQLAYTAEPARRAACLRRLRALTAERLGAGAADVLDVIAGTEDPAGTRPEPPRWWFVAPRIVIGVFFTAMALVVAVPGLDDGTRDALAVVLLGGFAAFFGVLWLIARSGSGAR